MNSILSFPLAPLYSAAYGGSHRAGVTVTVSESDAPGGHEVILMANHLNGTSTVRMDAVDAVILVRTLKAALDKAIPGAFNPLPDGDPNAIEGVILHAEADTRQSFNSHGF